MFTKQFERYKRDYEYSLNYLYPWQESNTTSNLELCCSKPEITCKSYDPVGHSFDINFKLLPQSRDDEIDKTERKDITENVEVIGSNVVQTRS